MAREQLCSGGGSARTFHTNRFFTYNPSDKKKAKPFFFDCGERKLHNSRAPGKVTFSMEADRVRLVDPT